MREGTLLVPLLKKKCARIALGKECHLVVLYRQSFTAIPG